MIEYLQGILLRNDGGHVVVDVGGVGYGLDVPLTTSAALPPAGEKIELHVYLYLQEQILRLYGFLTEQERDVFEVFLGTSGIGPKTALGILSSIEISEFATAVLREEISTLTRIPGIGKKTAERLIVELRDKMKMFIGATAQGATGSGPSVPGRASLSPTVREAVAALETLGCKPATAERAVQRALEVLGPATVTEDLVREALKHRR
jgi:holliday junction DNA helicase RuvA